MRSSDADATLHDSPALAAYGALGARGLDAMIRALVAACRLDLDARATAPPGGTVLCYWHQDALLGFVYAYSVLMRDARPNAPRLVALCHPAAYLRPWFALADLRGWRVIAGSTGHGGREAADAVVASLREGYVTFVCPDGPAGPPHVPKRGALHMAAQAGTSILPLRFECSRELRLPTWDGMRVPLPGATVRVRAGEPIRVDPSALGAAEAALVRALA